MFSFFQWLLVHDFIATWLGLIISIILLFRIDFLIKRMIDKNYGWPYWWALKVKITSLIKDYNIWSWNLYYFKDPKKEYEKPRCFHCGNEGEKREPLDCYFNRRMGIEFYICPSHTVIEKDIFENKKKEMKERYKKSKTSLYNLIKIGKDLQKRKEHLKKDK